MTSEPSPKDRFTSLDTYALVQELRRWRGARVDKAFDAGASSFSFSLRSPALGRSELTVVPGRYAALLPTASEHAEDLSPLARELRRLLSGAAISRVSDPAGERYLEVELVRASDPAPTVLAVELFGTGNLVVARDGRIAAVAHPRRWAHRELRIGASYARPPSRDDPWALGVERIREELEASRRDLTTTLAARLALGGPVAEEVVARAGLDPAAPTSGDAADLAGRLHTVLRELVAEVGEAPKGHLVRRGGEPVDATPYRPKRWAAVEGVSTEETPTFSAAAHLYFSSTTAPVVSPEEKAREAEREGLERLAARQRSAADELAANVDRLRSDAEWVYAHYEAAESALKEAAAKERPGRELRVVLEGRTVTLVVGKDVEGAARALYEGSKRHAAKLEGARAALAETESRLAGEQLARSRAAPTSPAPSRRKERWFEKYRWFVSSEGVLAIAGRDAASNDVVVRRHLKAGDVYLHADLQGAASVVVKRPQGASAIGPTTLREAAQWAVAYSKAWRAGLASASAFWAEPDQVSKSAETGEFVPKGAWVVRGTKHYERDVPLELAVGTVELDGEPTWSVAPEAALRARGTVRYLLTPGEERERARTEEELVRELGIPRSLLQRLLPAGGIAARRA